MKRAIIVDIDGTVCERNIERPYDTFDVTDRAPKYDVIEVLRTLVGPHIGRTTVIFMSGRDEVCRDQTMAWLFKHVGAGLVWGELLLMRMSGDYRRDSIVKRELYEAHVAGKFDVLCVLDDRDQVVEMWRDLGLLCLQVAPGDF